MADRDTIELYDGEAGRWVARRMLAVDLPLALADVHHTTDDDAPALIRVFGWSEGHLRDVCEGAGLDIEQLDVERREGHPARMTLQLRRLETLADTVGPGMRLLVCGLNPSPYSVETGVGFGRPGNRFWPAARDAGLATRDRDPRHALTVNGIGMTDLVKRQTRTAAELSTEEYRAGVDRVERLVAWLGPAAVCFVGLAGWRAAVDRKASAGLQPDRFGGSPVYLMPSTSGLNASSQLPDLTAHLRAALDLADSSDVQRPD